MFGGRQSARSLHFLTMLVLEGDVHHRMYSEAGFLNVFEQQWTGSGDTAHAYAPLRNYLVQFH